ncbi:MAG: hypothetical protein R3314_13410 [Longimicrobiales bacterium]|nr:hypothetical protein [Longimicrobiales bacterium]
MTPSDGFEVYFRRPDDAVVFAMTEDSREVSLVHRYGDGSWHCALCNARECRHIEVARAADPATTP